MPPNYPMMDRRPLPWMMGGDGHHGSGMPPMPPGGARFTIFIIKQ